jgi:cytochrome P450
MTAPYTTAEFAPVELPTTRTHLFDPAPELSTLREQRPLCRLRYPDGHVGWLVTSYALARQLLLDPRFTVRKIRSPVGDPATMTAFYDAMGDLPEFDGILMEHDPPQHTRIRRALAGYFTVRGIGEHRASIERIVAGRLDAMEAAGQPVDLMETFALPVSSFTICEILGAPWSDRERFERPSVVLQDPHASPAEKRAAMCAFMSYCRDVIAQKRAEPAGDLLSDLVVRGELTDAEIAGVAFQLFAAGHETTSNMIALSTFALLCRRDRWETLRADPSRVDAAVEQLLRYLTILQVGAFTRTALEEVELGGVRIQVGESVTVSLAAANRDPEKFSDPDELDLSDDAAGHVAFGYGRHMCLGQHLARLEMKIALPGLTRRFPTLRLAVPAEEVSFSDGEHLLYGIHTLPVGW